MRKHTIITKIVKVLIIIVLGTGAFILGTRLGKIPAREDQRLQVRSSRSSRNFAAQASDAPKEESTEAEPERSSVYTSTSAFSQDDHQQDGQYDDDSSQIGWSEIDWSEIDWEHEWEEHRDEYQEILCMALMHENGWYRPEDVPLTYGPAPQVNPPLGVYIELEVFGTGGPPIKRPPEVQARNREIEEEIERAREGSDYWERIRLAQEWIDLNAPYRSSITGAMLLQGIPKSWHYYFDDLFRAERERVRAGFAP